MNTTLGSLSLFAAVVALAVECAVSLITGATPHAQETKLGTRPPVRKFANSQRATPSWLLHGFIAEGTPLRHGRARSADGQDQAYRRESPQRQVGG
jgi:hypothetical protein